MFIAKILNYSNDSISKPEEKFRNLQTQDELFLHFYINEPAYIYILSFGKMQSQYVE